MLYFRDLGCRVEVQNLLPVGKEAVFRSGPGGVVCTDASHACVVFVLIVVDNCLQLWF